MGFSMTLLPRGLLNASQNAPTWTAPGSSAASSRTGTGMSMASVAEGSTTKPPFSPGRTARRSRVRLRPNREDPTISAPWLRLISGM